MAVWYSARLAIASFDARCSSSSVALRELGSAGFPTGGAGARLGAVAVARAWSNSRVVIVICAPSAASPSRYSSPIARTSGDGSGITTSMRSRPCGCREISRTPCGFTRRFSESTTWASTRCESPVGGIPTAYTMLTPPRRSLPRRMLVPSGKICQTQTPTTSSANISRGRIFMFMTW